MQLYTSLVRLKQAMNGGQLPPMTPVTGKALEIIDPAFTIGLGALAEDAEKGLRCPVRDCGLYFHRLQRHLNAAHGDVGGSHGVRRALSIPSTAPLSSQRSSEKTRVKSVANDTAAKVAGRYHGNPDAARRRGRSHAVNASTVGARNLRNRCDSQTRNGMFEVRQAVGRSPSINDAVSIKGVAWVGAVTRMYGSWNAAKAQFALEMYAPRGLRKWKREAVLEALLAYYEANGCLPTQRQCQKASRLPLIPSRETIVVALGANGWTHAMQIAASMLDIRGGRYGLPEKKAS